MGATPKISVITSVYQSEKELSDCVRTVLAQSFKNFELLLINDGSTDSTGQLCELFSEKHQNIRVFHQENAGPSVARNKGIVEARGEYITFIDADDIVDANFLDGFFTLNKNPKEAVVMQGYVREYKDRSKRVFDLPDKQYNREEFAALFYETKLIRRWPFTVSKLYDAEIIRREKLFFEPGIHYGEDLIFLLQYLNFANYFILSGQGRYHYLYHSTSLSRSLYGYAAEIKRLNLVKAHLKKLGEKLSFDERLNAFHHRHFYKYFYRALGSLYLPPHREKRKSRIRILKESVANGNYRIFKKAEKGSKTVKLVAYFIDRGWFGAADLVLALWFAYRKIT